MKSVDQLRHVFTQNRTEELGEDVWEHFVVPPFFDRLDLQQARKPRVILGGRGCGKTMLLRYLSYHSTFSPDRPFVPVDAKQHIGLYWRADTQFTQLMTGRGLSEDTWSQAFNHLLALVVATDVLDSIFTIASRGLISLEEDDLRNLRLPSIEMYNTNFQGGLQEIRDILEATLRSFELWVSNVGKLPEPIFLPGKHFVSTLVRECKRRIPGLEDAIFFVYLDEYENLLVSQQRIINTYLKHSEMPLIYNLAMKRNGFATQKTISEESIVDIADYRTHDIEEYLDENFDLFAAEVLLLTLDLAGYSVPVDTGILRDPSSLPRRRDIQYHDQILNCVRSVFPNISHEELAEGVFKDSSLQAKLRRNIERALKNRGSAYSVDQFIKPAFPQASIVTSALLYRRQDPQSILSELEALEQGLPNKFTGPTDWIHNNFIGCVLALYEGTNRVCPIYAGFNTFSTLAKGNLRHFLELCHKSLNDLNSNDLNLLSIDQFKQAQAARQASTAFLGQIKSFGRLGNKLHTFVLRLGSLFALAHQRPSQSEPEQAHFSIIRGSTELTEEDQIFLSEAIKWSVLFAEVDTKAKNMHTLSEFDYVLNPIYAPYFNITYRKIRKLYLSIDEFIILERGSYDDVNNLLKMYSKKWKINLPDASLTLFAHMLED
jgi:hypothetical protein